MRWQNPEIRDMGVTTLAYWADVRLQICPTGASSVPILTQTVIRIKYALI